MNTHTRRHTHTDSLKHKRLPPEQDIIHEFTAGSGIEDSVERDLTVISLLGVETPGLQDPEREMRVNSTHMVSVGAVAVCEAGGDGGREGGGEGERKRGKRGRRAGRERGERRELVTNVPITATCI